LLLIKLIIMSRYTFLLSWHCSYLGLLKLSPILAVFVIGYETAKSARQ